MDVSLQYGSGSLTVDIPGSNVTVIEPAYVDGLSDERGAFQRAVQQPLGRPPLASLFGPDKFGADDRVAVVISDVTRPLPSERLLPWLLAELGQLSAEQFIIVVGTGSHRACTRSELERMLGSEILSRYEVVNHDAHEPSSLAPAGRTADGRQVSMNRQYVEARRRIVIGFIEPHFMAGFSGGYKGVFPGVADIASIQHYHRASVIGDARSTWGRLDDNPTQDQIREGGSLLPVDFCINVTLNRRRQLTGVFAGDPEQAHTHGADFVKRTSMIECPAPFPIVVTTNGGYPLDQSLYQTVKGLSAAAQVVQDGGLIVAAARCNDGFPAHGNFKKLLHGHRSADDLLSTIVQPGFAVYDQWQAQLLAKILLRATVGLHSELPDDEVRAAHIQPVSEIRQRLLTELQNRGDVPIAVLPEGPMTIPYLSTPR